MLCIFVCGSCVVSTPKFEQSRLIHHMIRLDRHLIGNFSGIKRLYISFSTLI